MKITSAELFVLKSPGLYRNPENAEEPLGPTYMGLVKISTDAGICGYSDVETAPVIAKAAIDAPRWSEPGMECFDGLASLLEGENPLETERLWYKMYRGSIYYGRRGVAIQAISALDIALWDIAGKFYGQPIHILLGGKWRDRVRAYASTLFRPNSDAIREAAKGYLDQGFTAVKFGWGVFGREPKLDLKLVEAARKELGEENDLMVDTGWFVERTPKEALRLAGQLEQFQPFFLEEMLHPEDYDGYRTLSEGTTLNIACGEQEATEWGFEQLIDRGQVDVLQPDLTRCGGFTAGRKIVHMAERANRLVVPHSWSSDLLTAASLHLNAYQRRGVFVEFNTSQGPLSRSLAKNPIELTDGYVKVPEGPGLGVEVDEEIIAKYRIA